MTRLPPSNAEAEVAVLGSVLRGGKDSLFSIMHLLHPSDFFAGKNRMVYDAMVHLGEQGVAIDTVTVGNLLQERGKLKAVGGAIVLSNLLDGVATVANIDHYAKIVRDKASIRRMIYAAQEVSAAGFKADDAEEYLDSAVAQINKAVRHRQSSGDFVIPEDGLPDILMEITEGRSPTTIIPTGFKSVDAAYGGIVSPLLYLVAGRPSMGKSTLLLSLGIQLALKGKKVLYCTLEDSAKMQQMRMLTYFSGVPLVAILRGTLNDEDRRRVLDSTAWLHDLPITFTAKRGLYARDIRRLALAYQAEHGLDVLMVDHLGYIRGAPKEYERNSFNIRAMADLAGELNVPLMLAYQLNRDVEKRDNKRPKLSDLRGTGTAEEDARAIWFVYRPHYYYPQTEPANLFQIIVAKASFGHLTTLDLACNMQCYRIGDLPSSGEGY